VAQRAEKFLWTVYPPCTSLRRFCGFSLFCFFVESISYAISILPRSSTPTPGTIFPLDAKGITSALSSAYLRCTRLVWSGLPSTRPKRVGSCARVGITSTASDGDGHVHWAFCILPPMFRFLRWQLVRRDDNCLQPVLRKVLRIESHEEVSFTLFGAETERIILWVWRNLDRGTDSDFCGPFANQVHDSSD
jgi:hypothetical protein